MQIAFGPCLKCLLCHVLYVLASIPAVGVQLSGASFYTRRRARAALSQYVPRRGAAVPIPATGGLDKPNPSARGDYCSSYATIRRGAYLPLSRYVGSMSTITMIFLQNGKYSLKKCFKESTQYVHAHFRYLHIQTKDLASRLSSGWF